MPGFTRFELATILLAIGVLVALAVPNIQEARIRRGFSQHRGDMRSIATAIESYFVDHNLYPAQVPLANFTKQRGKLARMGGANLCAMDPGRPGRCDGLTTPVGYIIGTVLQDFMAANAGLDVPYAYYADAHGWILFSPGPDGDYDITDPSKVYDSSIPQPSPLLSGGPWTYDPTNGTLSSGDVYRVHQ